MWGRERRTVEVPDDTGEAQAIRQETQDEMYELRLQSGEVDSMVRKLVRRRELNHFGQDLSVTFRPRGAR